MKVIIANKNDIIEITNSLFDDITSKKITVGIDPEINDEVIKHIKNSDNIKKVISLSNKLEDINEIMFNEFDILILKLKKNGTLLDNIPNTSFNNLITINAEKKCMGLKKIMASKRIILIARENMKDEVYELLNGLKSETFPASLLVEHENIVLITDKESATLI